MAVSEELREEMGKKGNVELMMSETSIHVSLVSRPHPAHVRRRGRSGVISPNPWASSRSVEQPIRSQSKFIRIMWKGNKYFNRTAQLDPFSLHELGGVWARETVFM